MSINIVDLRALPPLEKLQLVELLWDELGETNVSIPLPEWVTQEAARRLDELTRDPSCGVSHEEVWRRSEQRHG